ncbi:hypothetical protein SAMN05892883_1745 [Jatrophihabitans sp. GAS493]|uniref:hypothetical protein n=1 Tax=Jatrophihabitans sp. GAS493 TaxID=1907575 RepID=UPI000BB94124|nr:hypothetical protein [Jatrophihabitans sp. GAS493]SOD72346.1 hypothetical protein SAMN05892883_1745 [Jatrophihabitans sp. GAS493]
MQRRRPAPPATHRLVAALGLLAGIASLVSLNPSGSPAAAAPIDSPAPVALMAPRSDVTLTASSRRLFDLRDPAIDEASGLVVGSKSPGVLYAQNDSGDSARFFAMNAETGATVAVCTVHSATNVDWEDMAGGHDVDGKAYIWIGDIGDNDSSRDSITVYQVPEPTLAASDRGVPCSVTPTKTWKLRYPDGAQNAESLMFDPLRHRLYIATKTFSGSSNVYLVPQQPTTGVQQLQRIASISVGPTDDASATNGPVGVAGGFMVTGGAFSPDGSLLVLRTYSSAHLWRVNGGDVAAALQQPQLSFDLPAQPQGEGIAFTSVTGTVHTPRQVGLLIDSEKSGSGVYAVTLTLPPVATPTPVAPIARSSAIATPDSTEASSGQLLWVLLAASAGIAVVVGVIVLLRARRP